MSHFTLRECLAGLDDLGGKDAAELHTLFDGMLDALLATTPPSRLHLDVLERMREPLERALGTRARQECERPVAPGTLEDGVLLRIVATWNRMGDAYALITGDTGLGNTAGMHALLAQRRTDCRARAVFEYMRAHRAAAPGLWRALHESLLDAEARGLAWTRVSDPLNPWKAQSAAEAHTTLLLMDLSSPFSRSPREFDQIRHCALHFAPHCRLLPEEDDSASAPPAAYGIDLHADHGMRPMATMSGLQHLRHLDGLQLSERFREAIARIRQQQSASALGLGRSVGVEEAVRLLLSLYRPWVRGVSQRRFARRLDGGTAEIIGDWKAIGFYVSGQPFIQPSIPHSSEGLHNDFRMLTLGERVSPISTDDTPEIRQAAELRGYICTQWEILDQSLDGFHLRRHGSTERLEHRQLIAIRPREAKAFQLGMISWVMYGEDGALETGIKLLAGVPVEVAVRSAGIGREHYADSFQPAFRLSETPALKAPATLVLPAGYFHPFRVVEIHDGGLRGYRLLERVMRGADFDQVTFEAISVGA